MGHTEGFRGKQLWKTTYYVPSQTLWTGINNNNDNGVLERLFSNEP